MGSSIRAGEVEIVDPVECARAGGLRYVADTEPGIRRRRAGRSFRYVDPRGRPVRGPAVLRRIRSLAIPPAWTDVWISARDDGHVQATGRDAKGRKQYRYHPRWRAVRDETKYSRMIPFAEALPRIRAHVEADLRRPGLPREKVLATVVRLLETTHVRVGNEEYAQANDSFGLTTMRDGHARIAGPDLRFRFRAKGGKVRHVSVRDARLARIVKRCRDLPGQELFQYVGDDGTPCAVDSADVNAYLREIAGDHFTAKDFRTWAGTVAAAVALAGLGPFRSATVAKRNVVHAIAATAERLGNMPAVCRKCYVHPTVIDAYLARETIREARERTVSDGLDRDEAAVLRLLRGRLAREAATTVRRASRRRRALSGRRSSGRRSGRSRPYCGGRASP